MATYVLDFVSGEYRDTPSHQGCFAFTKYKYYFNIDTRGNVKIKEQNIFVCSGHPNEHGPVTDILVINDNIPIPRYLNETLKTLIIGNFTHNDSSSLGTIINSLEFGYLFNNKIAFVFSLLYLPQIYYLFQIKKDFSRKSIQRYMNYTNKTLFVLLLYVICLSRFYTF